MSIPFRARPLITAVLLLSLGCTKPPEMVDTTDLFSEAAWIAQQQQSADRDKSVARQSFLIKQLATAMHRRGCSRANANELPDHERSALAEIVQFQKQQQPNLDVDADAVEVSLHRRHLGRTAARITPLGFRWARLANK